jgi:hypothetical protein
LVLPFLDYVLFIIITLKKTSKPKGILKKNLTLSRSFPLLKGKLLPLANEGAMNLPPTPFFNQ